MPDWGDSAIWKDQHTNLKHKYENTNPYATWPTPESFRDYCYDEAEKDKEVKDCNSTWGWCERCVRDKKWDNKK